ncbi:hypothetical protein E6O75_ATG02654 [Venturia nashicola]|uniref:DUF7730 domain-containing protein n=1 Tax=Venturia nashicola TaxID=86259 RepID=A0A4Z1PB20_9PEZI|nr:hypothetical protein E6O75_ATG02654 [Venturia nashicola]
MLGNQSHTGAPMALSPSSTCSFTPVASRPTKVTSRAIDGSAADVPRYSKRKRSQVTYNEIDEDDFLLPSHAEEEYRPKAKKSRKSGKPLPKHKIFPFMELPAELRNRIYGFALSDDGGGIHITSTTKGYRRIAKRCAQTDCIPQFPQGNRGYHRFQGNDAGNGIGSFPQTMHSFVPNVLSVSKTIYAEAAPLLYGQRISFADNYSLLSFLNQIGRQHTGMLREICIKSWCSGRAHRSINFPAMTLLASATNLELLEIDCALGFFQSYGPMKLTAPTRAARKAFRDCYPWFEAIGRVKGRSDAAIDMIKVHPSNFSMGNCPRARSTGQDEEKLRENLAVFQKELRRLLRT